MKLGIKGKLQSKMQDAMAEQAYLCYKFGWHQAQVKLAPKLSKKDFCKMIALVISEGKRISDGLPGTGSDELFPNGFDGIKDI